MPVWIRKLSPPASPTLWTEEQRLKDEELVEAFALQQRAEQRMLALNEESAKAGKKFLENAKKKA